MQPNAPSQPNMPPSSNDYSFIVNPDSPAAKRSLPGTGSSLARGLIVLGGVIVLIVLFNVAKGLLSGGGIGPFYLDVAQDQQSMIHITDNATKEPTISGDNKNFAFTAELSLTSDQSKIFAYLRKNHTKIESKKINLKVSQALDTQLTGAAAASNYNPVFAQIMQTKLTNYDKALQQAYANTKGVKGRELLKSEHNNTQLLLKQLEAANK